MATGKHGHPWLGTEYTHKDPRDCRDELQRKAWELERKTAELAKLAQNLVSA